MPSETLGVWAEIVGTDCRRRHIGNPIVSQLLADDARLAQLHPAVDVHVLSDAIARSVGTRPTDGFGVDSHAHAKRLATLLLPDTLKFDPARPSGFAFAAMNGRRPEDAIDPVVQTVLAGAPRPGRGARC